MTGSNGLAKAARRQLKARKAVGPTWDIKTARSVSVCGLLVGGWKDVGARERIDK